MTVPVPNIDYSPIVVVKDNSGKVIGQGFLQTPWNSFFQQFTQAASAAIQIPYTFPFSYTPNQQGAVAIDTPSGVIPTVTLIRGRIEINLGETRIVPMRIGDTIKIELSGAIGAPLIYFLPD